MLVDSELVNYCSLYLLSTDTYWHCGALWLLLYYAVDLAKRVNSSWPWVGDDEMKSKVQCLIFPVWCQCSWLPFSAFTFLVGQQTWHLACKLLLQCPKGTFLRDKLLKERPVKQKNLKSINSSSRLLQRSWIRIEKEICLRCIYCRCLGVIKTVMIQAVFHCLRVGSDTKVRCYHIISSLQLLQHVFLVYLPFDLLPHTSI